jgi:hypothetical protein
MKTFVIAVLAVAAVALSGCGKSCKDLCNHPCNGASVVDCQNACNKFDALNKVSNCGSQYDKMISCFAGESDADRCSSTNTSCNTPANDWGSCTSSYCTAHASDSACTL